MLRSRLVKVDRIYRIDGFNYLSSTPLMVQNIVRIAHVMESEEEKECVARVAKRVVKDEK